jgi:hypothetical protein
MCGPTADIAGMAVVAGVHRQRKGAFACGWSSLLTSRRIVADLELGVKARPGPL